MAILAFDPGATTGFAALADDGEVLFTAALVGERALSFASFLEILTGGGTKEDVLIEVGPTTQHHSPVTRRTEAKLREMFPNAHLVPPNQWKSHPVSRRKRTARFATLHEQDAVSLARWFQATGGSVAENKDSAGANSSRTRRQHN